MGRPINSRYLGVTATDTASGSGLEDNNITALVDVGNGPQNGVVLRQRSETKFKVNDAPDGSGTDGVCTLVDKTTPGVDEMVVEGYQDGDITSTFTIDGGATPVHIRKFHNRTVFDFQNNRYTWYVQDLAVATQTVDGEEEITTYQNINALVLTPA